MISFMVLGGPRSATTWLANLLTTDTTICLHDALLEHTASDLDKLMVPGKRVGISDTSASAFPEWVNAHQCPKIILYRDIEQINASLEALGLLPLDSKRHAARLLTIANARMYQWNAVFHGPHAMEICKHLNVPFCPWRFAELKKMNIQPQMNRLPIGKEAARELVKRIAAAIRE
jgi:hypothetical protein